jgi:GDP/UDP-N,N'-diacetylbacillosamine 2-epimerase (hydrolysing)
VWEEAEEIIRVRNLDQTSWVALLRRANVLVGNSSAGLLETPFLGIPAVNVGSRQQGRRHAGNVEFVPAQEQAVRQAVVRALDDGDYREGLRHIPCPFGDGHAADRIVKRLLETDPRTLIPKHHLLNRRSV